MRALPHFSDLRYSSCSALRAIYLDPMELSYGRRNVILVAVFAKMFEEMFGLVDTTMTPCPVAR